MFTLRYFRILLQMGQTPVCKKIQGMGGRINSPSTVHVYAAMFYTQCLSQPAKLSGTLNGGHNAYSHSIASIDLPVKVGGAAA